MDRLNNNYSDYHWARDKNELDRQQIVVDLRKDPRTSLAGFFRAREAENDPKSGFIQSSRIS